MSLVAPPAQGNWFDADEVTAKVLARLRLTAGDTDESRIRALVDVAAGHINNELDRATPMTAATALDVDDVDEDDDTTELASTNVTPVILEALERVTIELYRRGRVDRRDAAGTIDAVGIDTIPVIEVVRDDISAHKSRFGFA